MSYDENDAARDAFYDQISNEAIDEFTADRLKSYYDDHFTTMQPALRTLHEATRLLKNDHPSAAMVFAAAAVELLLKYTILQPLIYGLIHNENMANVIVNYTLGQTGFSRYDQLLKDLFQEVAGVDITTVRRRTGAHKTLIEECKELSKQRNKIMHSGDTATREDATNACDVAQAVYWLFVAQMLTALGLYIFDDGVISRSEYVRPVRTVKNKNGVRVTAEAIDFNDRPTIAGDKIPVPPEPNT